MRRVFLIGLVAIFGLLPQLGMRVVAQEPLPIIDLHFHPMRDWNRAALVTLFDQLGVAKAGNGPGGPDSLALDFAKQYPGRFIPFAGLWELTDIVQTDGDRAWGLNGGRITSYLSRLENELASGEYKGIGELYPNNVNSHPWTAVSCRLASHAAPVGSFGEVRGTDERASRSSRGISG